MEYIAWIDFKGEAAISDLVKDDTSHDAGYPLVI
jgi:hypothetical protein